MHPIRTGRENADHPPIETKKPSLFFQYLESRNLSTTPMLGNRPAPEYRVIRPRNASQTLAPQTAPVSSLLPSISDLFDHDARELDAGAPPVMRRLQPFRATGLGASRRRREP